MVSATVDTRVLNAFTPWHGRVPAGYFPYFLGNLTRADYWAFPKDVRAAYDCERSVSLTAPAADDNIFDWIVLLEAVLEARGEFTMAALGAGWGRWLVAGAFAAIQRGLTYRLIGVEAEPTHFQWMREHFHDNGIDPDAHELIEAAVAGRAGSGWFYVGKPDAWYGQSLVREDIANESIGSIREYNDERIRRVPTVDLATIIERHARVDYCHMDVQGSELDILTAGVDTLDRKIRRVLVGTHAESIERGLRALFSSLRWTCQYDVPLNGQVDVDGTVVTVGDGVQVWINPRLAAK